MIPDGPATAGPAGTCVAIGASGFGRCLPFAFRICSRYFAYHRYLAYPLNYLRSVYIVDSVTFDVRVVPITITAEASGTSCGPFRTRWLADDRGAD